ncbi:hypothetical protein ACHAWF_005695, partial [Thalassiosira exigua]
ASAGARRSFAGLASSWEWAPDVAAAAVADFADPASLFTSYRILPDASAKLDPSLERIAPLDQNNILVITDGDGSGGGGGALWLGEHDNSANDCHLLRADFVRNIHRRRQAKFGGRNGNMAVGLEIVQVQFQQALDDCVLKKISAEEMKTRVQWDERWSWSFENYLPVFETCRELNVPLVALNVDSEDLSLVEIGGFPNLPQERIQKYISDPAGFAQFASNPYKTIYVDYVISSSYDLHQSMGILRTTITGQQLEQDMSFSRFFRQVMQMLSFHITIVPP